MKKFVSTMLVSVLMLCMSGFAATADAPDAYTVYKRAMKKLGEAATIQTTATYALGQSYSSYSYDELEAQIILTQTQTEEKGLQLEARMIEDEDTILYMYYKDGYYYQRIDAGTPNTKRKTKMSEKKVITECFGIDRTLKKDNFNCAELERTDDGYTLKYKIKGENFRGMYANAMSAIYNEDETLLTMKTSDVTYTLNIGKDGALESYRISFVTRFSDYEYESVDRFDISNRISCKVTTDNQAKKIKYPENLDVYREIEL